MKNMKSMKGWKIRRFAFLKPNLHVLQALHDDIPSSSCPLPWPCVVVFGLIGTTIVTTSLGGDTNWPAFRGANAAGVPDGATDGRVGGVLGLLLGGVEGLGDVLVY